jgi:hypothetical protein
VIASSRWANVAESLLHDARLSSSDRHDREATEVHVAE